MLCGALTREQYAYDASGQPNDVGAKGEKVVLSVEVRRAKPDRPARRGVQARLDGLCHVNE